MMQPSLGPAMILYASLNENIIVIKIGCSHLPNCISFSVLYPPQVSIQVHASPRADSICQGR